MRRLSPARHLPVLAAASAAALFAASPAVAGSDQARAEGELTRYPVEGTYPVPAGATARVHAVYDTAGDTIITLHVRGLEPNTEYGAHAHVNACHPTDGAAAGPHFQHVLPGEKESPTDPKYANPGNEIWLDFTTNAAGNAVARSTVAWQFAPERRPGSVIIHQRHTHPGPQDAGTAGARLACLTVAF